MGINSLPALEDYWKQSLVYHYAPVADRTPPPPKNRQKRLEETARLREETKATRRD